MAKTKRFRNRKNRKTRRGGSGRYSEPYGNHSIAQDKTQAAYSQAQAAAKAAEEAAKAAEAAAKAAQEHETYMYKMWTAVSQSLPGRSTLGPRNLEHHSNS